MLTILRPGFPAAAVDRRCRHCHLRCPCGRGSRRETGSKRHPGEQPLCSASAEAMDINGAPISTVGRWVCCSPALSLQMNFVCCLHACKSLRKIMFQIFEPQAQRRNISSTCVKRSCFGEILISCHRPLHRYQDLLRK